MIKVEPIDGDRTRLLKGSGSGYFPVFNRNKQSLAVDLKSTKAGRRAQARAAGRHAARNFRDDSLAQYGLDYESLSPDNPKLIYISLKGFLSGPYKNRTALDEVVQMMGGLAYINGGENSPQRVAASVNDILGGTFGVVGALAALHDRHATGKGRHIRSGPVREQPAAGRAVHRPVPVDGHCAQAPWRRAQAALGACTTSSIPPTAACSSRW